jgi:hypothetical protein
MHKNSRIQHRSGNKEGRREQVVVTIAPRRYAQRMRNMLASCRQNPHVPHVQRKPVPSRLPVRQETESVHVIIRRTEEALYASYAVVQREEGGSAWHRAVLSRKHTRERAAGSMARQLRDTNAHAVPEPNRSRPPRPARFVPPARPAPAGNNN